MNKDKLSRTYTNVHTKLVESLKEYVRTEKKLPANVPPPLMLYARCRVLAECLDMTAEQFEETLNVYREKWSD